MERGTTNSMVSNLWKYFLVNFTGRRNFVPILSVYFLTLPGTTAHQIGIYTGIGYLASMIMQLPAGMIADRWGQKNTLIISKVFLILSSLFFVFADNFIVFTLGAIICMSLGNDAFNSGIANVFLKRTLEALGRGSEFRKISSGINGNVALTSIVFIVLLPYLTTIDIHLPLIVGLFLDIIGLLTVLSLTDMHVHEEKKEKIGFLSLIQRARGSGFLSYALFAGIISGFLFADTAFRSPYLVELGYPLTSIGLVMGGSRLVWWIVGKNITRIEKYISFSRLILLEVFLFPIYYISTSQLTNPWIVGILFSLTIGWFWGRNEVYTDALIHRIHDEGYRSTLLSLKAQISGFVQVAIAFGITGVMGISYSLGFQVLGILMFAILGLIYFFGIREKSI